MLAVAVTGCSFPLVSGPPAQHADLPAFDCTESRLGPVLDSVWTGLELVNVALALARSDQSWAEQFGGDPPITRTHVIPVYAVLAAIGAAGMYYGYTRTAACRAAKAELAGRTPQTLGPPQGYGASTRGPQRRRYAPKGVGPHFRWPVAGQRLYRS